ncbi:thiol reductant ABC exporter subunit CydD [Lactobacillus crispatus]|uniref:thiol reductant ABC exporter subunit CydD n=1 Tax=Lactobacillus crispatus TaxID=47770 RepID=UPI001F094F21|nr:thiol reductant ABC exporter subunit CydD [Lactobacillus crispatus]
MIDKQLFKIDGAGSILKKLAGLEILLACFIVVQALAFGIVLRKWWVGEPLYLILLITFAACFIARQLISTLRDSMLEKYSGRVAEELRQQLLNKVFRDGQALVQKQGTGSLITMSLDGVDEVRQYIKLIYSKVLTMMIVPVLIFVGMLFLSWTSAVILLVMYPLIVLFMIILGHAAQDRAIKQFGNFQVLSNNFIDSLRGIDTLKYLGLSKRYSKSIFNLSEGFRKKTMAVLKVAMLSTFALDFFTTLSIAIIAVFLGFDLMNGKIALFPALGILILAPDYFLPIRDFAGDFHATLNGKNAFKRINEFIKLPEEKTNDLPLKTWSAQDQLKIKNLKFTYQKGTEIGPVSLQVQGFKKIGIIGMSGSGKTSLINLLSGFLTPDQVQIELQGQKTTTMNIPAWQRQMTYIPQEPYVFTKSLRENIAFYNPQASDDEIKQAIHIMGLDALLNDLPNGLDTVIGRGKRVLSGGQSQRIALARAFLDPKRKIMIFDEPTAHLDIETEIDLKKRMMPLMQNKLVFFATHRLHWLKEMDYILVMDHGQLVEQGSYEQLQQNQGYFCKLMAGMRGENNDQ